MLSRSRLSAASRDRAFGVRTSRAVLRYRADGVRRELAVEIDPERGSSVAAEGANAEVALSVRIVLA